MKKFTIIKLFGFALLSMAVLVMISIIEVAIYALLINPGQENELYQAHAKLTAPWVSGIFGFIIFFFVVRYWGKKEKPNLFSLALLFPLIYIFLDVLVLVLEGSVVWSRFYLTFLLANGSKILGSILGYYSGRNLQ